MPLVPDAPMALSGLFADEGDVVSDAVLDRAEAATRLGLTVLG